MGVVKICTAPGCDKPQKNQGEKSKVPYCGMHAERLRKYGSLELRAKPTMEEKFWSRVDKNGPVPSIRPELGSCWLWTGVRRRGGYGQFGRSSSAYVVSYTLLVGPVPDGLELDHLCRTPACVNPAHLEPVTHAENVRRGKWGEHVAAQKAITHCPQGHAYEGDNLIVRKGQRWCRICLTKAKRAYRQRQALGGAA